MRRNYPLIVLGALALIGVSSGPPSDAGDSNLPPTCCISGPDTAVVGQEVCFTSCSTDIDGTIVWYYWTFGEGNLVPNGDFEGGFTGGLADGWTPWKDPWGDAATYRAETTNQHGGAKCQAVDFTEMSGGIYQVINGTQAGKRYVFTGWVRFDTNAAGGPPWYELGWGLDGATTRPPDPPLGPWVQFQPPITGLPYGSWYSNHNQAVDPKSRVLTATGPKISIWLKWGAVFDPTPRTGYVDDVSLIEFETTETVCHTYRAPGEYTVVLTVTDSRGASATCCHEITVESPNLPPVCDVTYAPSSPTTDDVITFYSGAADPDGTVVSWEWDFADGGTAIGDPAMHVYADAGTYTVCAIVTDDQGGQATCCAQVAVRLPCECDVATNRTDCKMPAAGHIGQCKRGQIGAKNLSLTESCTVVLRLTDHAGNVVFQTTRTLGPGRRLRVRFGHCYTADQVGKNLWTWEVWPADCAERTPWNNVYRRKVNVHP